MTTYVIQVELYARGHLATSDEYISCNLPFFLKWQLLFSLLNILEFIYLFSLFIENIDLSQNIWHFSVNTHLPAVSSSLVHYSAFSRATIINVGTSVGH